MKTETGSTVPHGAYEQKSRYNLEQRRYAGGEVGYMSLYEVLDAPVGRCPVVIVHCAYTSDNVIYFFTEWATLADGMFAFGNSWPYKQERYEKLPGFLRYVDGAHLGRPWFYAQPGEEPVGDWISR